MTIKGYDAYAEFFVFYIDKSREVYYNKYVIFR